MEHSGAGSESGALDDATGPLTRRRQKAGFSIFLDQVSDDTGEHRWETRLYHAESGAETSMPGASPDEWIAWLLEQTISAGVERVPCGRRSTAASIRVASVDILDVHLSPQDVEGAPELQTVTARVVVQLSGIAGVEREIGSRILRGLTGSASAEQRPSEDQ